jgi:amino acid transporter
MVATTSFSDTAVPSQLRQGVLSLPETIGQSIANIAPTLTPALNISVVVGIAGAGSWLSYLIATVGCVFVGGCIATLAKRHPEAGSYFVYIGRNFGPVAGAMGGWFMILAYLACAIAVVTQFPLLFTAFLAALGTSLSTPKLTMFSVIFLGLVVQAAYRDIKLSSRLGLILEITSVSIIVLILALVVGRHGTVVDPAQLNIRKLHFGGVMSAMAFAVFSFVGFESSATLAKESTNPQKNVPFAVVGSVALAGTFFTLIAYFMVMVGHDNAAGIGNSSSPFSDMTKAAHLPWAASIVYLAAMISAFACALASLNAGSRMLFSMGRYRFLHGSLGLIHKTHRTPYVAVLASGTVVLIAFLAFVPQTFLNELNIMGTISTYGFVCVYLGVALTASMDMYRNESLKPTHVVAGVIGALLMLFVIYSSVYPWPEAPDHYLPEIFIAYAVIGLGWFLVLKAKSPQVLATIARDMEG